MAGLTPKQIQRACAAIQKIHARGACRRFMPSEPQLELEADLAALLPEALLACWRSLTLGEDRDAHGVVRHRDAMLAEASAYAEPFRAEVTASAALPGGLRLMTFVDGGAVVLALNGEHAHTLWRFWGTTQPAPPERLMAKGKPIDHSTWLQSVLAASVATLPPVLSPQATQASIIGPIQELPADYLAAPQLESLVLGATQLTTLPPELGTLVNLRKLIVGGESLSRLPSELAQLRELRWLALGATQVNALPVWVGELSKLETLELAMSPVKSLPEEIGELKQLSKLTLAKLLLEELPDGILKCTALRELSIKDTPLASVPLGLSELPALEQLVLERVAVSALPRFAGAPLTDLTLSELPLREGEAWAAVSELTQLRTLVLRGLALGSGEPPALPGLVNLRIYDCGLKELPQGIQQFIGLKSLCLDRNPLASIPDWVFELPALEELYLFNTPFSEAEIEAMRAAHPGVSVHWFAPRG